MWRKNYNLLIGKNSHVIINLCSISGNVNIIKCFSNQTASTLIVKCLWNHNYVWRSQGSWKKSRSLQSLQCFWSELQGSGKQFSRRGDQQCGLCFLHFRNGNRKMSKRNDCCLCNPMSTGSSSWQVNIFEKFVSRFINLQRWHTWLSLAHLR